MRRAELQLCLEAALKSCPTWRLTASRDPDRRRSHGIAIHIRRRAAGRARLVRHRDDQTRLGSFDFTNSYPAGDAAARLREALVFNRAVEAYLAQMHAVSWYRVWKGVAEAGSGTANQVVLWENLMDGATLLLTGNCETVYGLCAIDLKRDGPVVIEAPAMLLGGISDLWQREVIGHRPDRPRPGQGRQVPAAAAGLRRRSARRLHRRRSRRPTAWSSASAASRPPAAGPRQRLRS